MTQRCVVVMSLSAHVRWLLALSSLQGLVLALTASAFCMLSLAYV